MQVGDKVRYELSTVTFHFPRWDYREDRERKLKDLEGSGEWEYSVITEVDTQSGLVYTEMRNGSPPWGWVWPLENPPPGYLEKVEKGDCLYEN